MRILHCCPTSLNRRLGAAKVYIEAAEQFRALNWQADLVGTEEIAVATNGDTSQDRLREYLRRQASDYDVVEYEHEMLPFPRSDFPSSTLMVARSVLLVHHLLSHPIPNRPGLLRAVVGRIKGPQRRRKLLNSIDCATKTVVAADLVNVANADDAAELQRYGIDSRKIVILPFGLNAARRRELESVEIAPPAKPCVVFVGTFDPRKGMRIFPKLVDAVLRAVPDARFRLIGTAGMLKTADEVYAEFPATRRAAIEVIPSFEPQDLPTLLEPGSLGVFPSLVEGFPFGVLEMLTAGLPVVAFRAPGPPELLTDDFLVAPNDADSMASKVCSLLRDRPRLATERVAARERSRCFNWSEIIGRTAEIYEARVRALRAGK